MHVATTRLNAAKAKMIIVGSWSEGVADSIRVIRSMKKDTTSVFILRRAALPLCW